MGDTTKKEVYMNNLQPSITSWGLEYKYKSNWWIDDQIPRNKPTLGMKRAETKCLVVHIHFQSPMLP